MAKQVVAVLGASPKEDRYSNKAVKMLLEHGHTVIPIHPTADAIHGQACVKSLADIKQPVDTLTIYVTEQIALELLNDILALKPKRIIMNPGAESATVKTRAEAAGIKVVTACTLVLLVTKHFEKSQQEIDKSGVMHGEHKF